MSHDYNQPIALIGDWQLSHDTANLEKKVLRYKIYKECVTDDFVALMSITWFMYIGRGCNLGINWKVEMMMSWTKHTLMWLLQLTDWVAPRGLLTVRNTEDVKGLLTHLILWRIGRLLGIIKPFWMVLGKFLLMRMKCSDSCILKFMGTLVSTSTSQHYRIFCRQVVKCPA